MAKKVDIRKVVFPDCEYYESVTDTVMVTFIGRLKGITDFGHQTLRKRHAFGKLLRTLVKTLQSGAVPDKKVLCHKFNLPARGYNLLLRQAQGVIESAIECQKADLESTELDINRQVVEAFWGPSGELKGGLGKLTRLYRKRSQLLKQQGRPRIHFGKRFYQHQDEPGWKKRYQAARNDQVGGLGSSDELGGNSTFCIKPVHEEGGSQDGALKFEVYHARQLMGQFTLKPKQRDELAAILALNHQPFTFSQEVAKHGPRKGDLVLRKVTEGRVPLTVWLIRHENGHWYVHASFSKNKVAADYTPKTAIGVDLNADSIADTRLQVVDGEPVIVKHQKRMFDPSWSKDRKREWIYAQVNDIVQAAKATKSAVVLEYLDFEYCKRWLRTKLGALLRVMPYRQIRKAFERRCLEQGVVLRYVKSHYTSLLGAILDPNLGRDQAAAAVIGLRALEAGNAWLEQESRKLSAQGRTRLRINRKSKFGCSVVVMGSLIDRQSEAQPLKDRKTDVHYCQRRAARAISDLSKAMGAHFYIKKAIPTCWKRSSQTSDSWHPVVPQDAPAPSLRTYAQV
jgi:IS605 OrfB family transposase